MEMRPKRKNRKIWHKKKTAHGRKWETNCPKMAKKWNLAPFGTAGPPTLRYCRCQEPLPEIVGPKPFAWALLVRLLPNVGKQFSVLWCRKQFLEQLFGIRSKLVLAIENQRQVNSLGSDWQQPCDQVILRVLRAQTDVGQSIIQLLHQQLEEVYLTT